MLGSQHSKGQSQLEIIGHIPKVSGLEHSTSTGTFLPEKISGFKSGGGIRALNRVERGRHREATTIVATEFQAANQELLLQVEYLTPRTECCGRTCQPGCGSAMPNAPRWARSLFPEPVRRGGSVGGRFECRERLGGLLR